MASLPAAIPMPASAATAAAAPVPLELGRLRDSGRVEVADGEAVVSYDTDYAAILHEHPEFNFQNGRQGKWLQSTLESGNSLLERLGGYLMKALFR